MAILSINIGDNQPLVVAATTIVFGSILFAYFRKENPFKTLRGPKPSSYFLGHLLDTLGSVAKWKTVDNYPEPFLSWVKEFGGAVPLREVSKNVILLTDPTAIQHVMVINGPNYPRDPIARGYLADLTFGIGVISSEGQQHDAFRKLLNPLLTMNQVKSFLPIFERQVNRCCERKLSVVTGPINMSRVFQELTLEVIGLTSFGFDFTEHPKAYEAYSQYQLMPSPLLMIGLFTIPWFTHLPIPELNRRRQAREEIKLIMSDIIQNKIKNIGDGTPNDLLDIILTKSPNAHEAMVHIMTFLLGGHETSSTTLGWIFAALASHPHVVKSLRDEVDAVFEKHGSFASWEALAELKYTWAVIHESLRLNPATYRLARRVAESDDELPLENGSRLHLPKNTAIDINVAAMHRNPKYWTNPDEFHPERFLEQSMLWNADVELRGGRSHTFFYLPFSWGSKNCAGQRFATAELQLILATFILRFDFALTENADLRHRHNGLTIQPLHLEMNVTKRKI